MSRESKRGPAGGLVAVSSHSSRKPENGPNPSAAQLLHPAVWPIRPHLRPKPRRSIVTAADVDADLLRAFPDIVAELNLCVAYVWQGQGQPGLGWEGWSSVLVTLDEALGLSVGGEA